MNAQSTGTDRKTAQKAPPPAHEIVYRQMRDKVLCGDFVPGQAITIQGLVTDLAVGMTPAREAIRRLVAEGALEMQGNRRIVVPRLSLEALSELSFIRLAIEGELTRRAVPRVTKDVLREMTQIDSHLDRDILSGNQRGYLRYNHAFHHRLYALAEAPILMETVERLWLRFGPSLRVVVTQAGPVMQPDCHKVLLSALRDGDVAGAVEAIHADIRQGTERIASAHAD